uniref:Uncharacterized protein n=1 Tax=Helianthus annuus TaxID=4232 RepID=A0A251S2C0_HELAN
MHIVFCNEWKCYLCFKRVYEIRRWSVPMKSSCPRVLENRCRKSSFHQNKKFWSFCEYVDPWKRDLSKVLVFILKGF